LRNCSFLNGALTRIAFTLAVIFCLYAIPAVTAAEPVLFSQGNSYDPYVLGDCIVYNDFSDDMYGREPAWKESSRYGITRGRGYFLESNSAGNIYLYNISSNETIPVYKSDWRSAFPWIENDTIYWYESTLDSIVFKDDPTSRDIYLYSVPVERISPVGAENHSLLNPNVTVARENKWEFLKIKCPDYSSDSIEIVHAGNGTSDLLMYYTDPSSGNRTMLASGYYVDYASPQIYDGRIFWEDYRSGYSQIYVYDIETGREYQVAPQPFSQYDCSVDGDIISWTTYGGDLYYTNISGLIGKEQPENGSASGTPESGPGALLAPFAAFAGMAVSVIRGKNR
jgi:beta propeller repeat protein